MYKIKTMYIPIFKLGHEVLINKLNGLGEYHTEVSWAKIKGH